MDQGLLELFDRQETARRFTDLDRRSAEAARQFLGFRDVATQRLTRIEERIQHSQIPLDGIRNEICSLRKEVMGVGDKLESSLVELRGQIGELRELLLLGACNRSNNSKDQPT